MRSAGMGSERGVGRTDAAGVFELDLTLAGGKGVGAGCKIETLYTATSGCSGCWIMGAETTGSSFGISENLSISQPPRLFFRTKIHTFSQASCES